MINNMSGEKLRPTEASKKSTNKMSCAHLWSTVASGKTRPKCLARNFGLQKLQSKHDRNVWRELSAYRSFRQKTIKMSGKNHRSTEASGKTRPKCLARNFGLLKPQAKHDLNVWQEASVYRSFRQNMTKMSGKKLPSTEASGKTR